MHQNLTMSILEILVTTTQLWVIHPCQKAERVYKMPFPWMIYLHFEPQCKARRRMAAEGKSSSPSWPSNKSIFQEALCHHCLAICTGRTAQTVAVQWKQWIHHLKALSPYSLQRGWSMCYIIMLCVLVCFSRKPLWNKVKLIHITMVALTGNLIIAILHTKSRDQNYIFFKYFVFKTEIEVNSLLLLSVI